MGPKEGTIPSALPAPRGSTHQAHPTQAPPCLGQEGTPKPPQSVISLKSPLNPSSSSEPLPQCTHSPAGWRIAWCPVTHLPPLVAMRVLSLPGPLFPHLGNGLIVVHVLDCGGESGAHSVEPFQWCLAHRSTLRIC